jgi:hypothetical protein
MVSFPDALGGAIKAAYCFQVANNPIHFSNLSGIFTPSAARRAADNFNRWVCNKGPVDFPEPEFLGGQCPGKRYLISYEARVNNSGNWTTYTNETTVGPGAREVYGPVTVLGDRRWNAGSRACGLSFTGSYEIEFSNSDGTPNWGALNIQGSFCPGSQIINVRNLVFSRLDSGAECGDGPIDLPPPGNIETEINIDYGDDNEFNLTVPLIFAPVYVALDGSLNIPFEIGDINLSGELNLTNEGEITLDFSRGTDPGQADDTDLPSGDETGDGDDPPTGPEERIIGVMVRVTDLGDERVTVIPQTVGPAVVAPRAATVKFLARFGGITGWTPDIAVKSVRTYIPCPIPSGAVDVQVTPDFGSSVEFTPIRGRPLTEP